MPRFVALHRTEAERIDRADADRLDRLLLDRVRHGDADALSALARTYWSRLVGYAARMVDNVESGEDIAQETFLRLWERRGEWKENRSARVLLYTITRNLALNHSKSAAVKKRVSLDDHPDVSPTEPGPLELLQEAELSKIVKRAIDMLPERRREVFILSRYHDLSRNEIAALTRLAPQTVANHLTLAVADLRKVLSPYLRA